MIDYLKIQTFIKINIKKLSSTMLWKNIEDDYGNNFYFHKRNSVEIRYYPDTTKLVVEGKISQLFSDSQVLNVDDIFGTDTDVFVDAVNEKLRMLFDTDTIDVRTFRVVRIDYCFNVKTPYVSEYLEFMSAAFQHRNKGRRTDFTHERDLSGSLYIKPTGEYKNNQRKGYCLNFYDKSNWIANQENKNIYISEEDKERASDVFRLEIQCYSDKIKRICEKHKIENCFANFCDISLAYNTICDVYTMIFGGDTNCSYVQYAETKNIRFSDTVRKGLIASSQHHDISQYSAKKAIERNIYPYYFLSPKGKIKRLENSMILILNKINDMLSPI